MKLRVNEQKSKAMVVGRKEVAPQVGAERYGEINEVGTLSNTKVMRIDRH